MAAQLGIAFNTESLHRTLGVVFTTSSNFTPVARDLSIVFHTQENVSLVEGFTVEG